MNKKTVLIFTGGGLAPALNPTLYGAITRARKEGFRILGGLYGWACLGANGKTIDLTKIDLEIIKKNGGTFLRSSPTHPFNSKNGLAELKKRIKKLKIDYIIAIGGDDTLGAAYKLHQQSIIPIDGAPKIIDNDLPETYWSPGFPSAAYYFSQFVKEIREDAAYALSRFFIVEALTAKAGWNNKDTWQIKISLLSPFPIRQKFPASKAKKTSKKTSSASSGKITFPWLWQKV